LVLAAGIAMALTYLPYRVLEGPEAETLRPMRQELREKRTEIVRLSRENREMRTKINALKNDSEAIEILAREDLGMVYPGELIISVGEESVP
jgi:cell division protein FtsB